jgi:hypothetical protein
LSSFCSAPALMKRAMKESVGTPMS